MLPYRDSTLTKVALAVFFLLIVGYAYFEARGILFGPTIQVAQTLEQVSSPYIELTGTTTHIATLSMNGQSVPVTEAGAFDIPFALSPGYNRIVLDATDKYGKTTEKSHRDRLHARNNDRAQCERDDHGNLVHNASGTVISLLYTAR